MAVGAGPALSPPGAEKSQKSEARNQEESRIERDQLEEARWRLVLGLVCQMSVDLPLPNITVADFLKWKPGSVLSTGWRLTRDVPLRINGTLIAWAEFDGTGGRMAVRFTEVA